MKPRQFSWKWLLLGLAAVSVLVLGIAFLPQQFSESSRLGMRVAGALSAWTGGEVKLTGPLHVRYFPDVAIKSGFELTNASRLPLVKSITATNAKFSLDFVALLLGNLRVDAMRLHGAEIALKDAPSPVMGPDQTLQARVANLLGGAPMGVVRVSDGILRVPTASGMEAVEKIDARFEANSRNGGVSSFGTFMLRGEKVGFAFNSGAPSQSGTGLEIPVTLKFTSIPVSAKISGTASLANALSLDAKVNADMPSVRQFLRWAGIPLTEGASLQRLTASGLAHWNGTTLTIDDGAFSLDGNAAVGLVAVTPGERPRIEGTLDFDRLALDPYLGRGAAAKPQAAQGPLAEQAILKHLDVDLRVSAADITAPSISLGQGGFTISAKNGVIASEVGELELCGGSATGRIGLDMREDVAKASFTASLMDIAVDGCLAPLALDIAVNGTGVLKAEFTTEGRNYDELTQGLDGSFKLDARNGAVPIDLARLLGTVTTLDGDGWSRNSPTLFDQLKTDCRLDSGHIWCETFNMQTRRGLISGSGNVDLRQQTLDWTLFVASDAKPLRASQLSTVTPPQIAISGPLARPSIRRADRPALGEGSAQTDPAAGRVSPR
jgi:AsmA protein